MNKKKKSPFEYIKDLTVNKKKYPDVSEDYLKDYEPVVINKILSMNFRTYPQLMKINKMTCASMPKEMHYRYLHSALKKQYYKIDYVKGKKNVNADNVKFVSEYYSCSNREALSHMEILTKDQIKTIKALYKTRI
jgi:hypothetical protein